MTAHPRYWQVKAAELQFRLDQQAIEARLREQIQAEYPARLQEAMRPALAKRAAVFQAADLDSSKSYVLTDDTETITEG